MFQIIVFYLRLFHFEALIQQNKYWGAIFSRGFHVHIVTRNNIVWKLARGYCLCYCKTFSLVPDSTECTKNFLPKSTVHYIISTYNTVPMCHLKSNNIIGQRKTTNTEKHLYL